MKQSVRAAHLSIWDMIEKMCADASLYGQQEETFETK